jgi:hypothetical protein
MSARKAFVLGAIVGAGVLAAVGAVSAGSSGSVAPASPRLRADVVPPAVFDDLKHIDKLLAKLIGDVRSGSLESGAQTIDRIAEIERAKREMVSAFFEQPIYGLKFSEVFFGLDCLDRDLGQGIGEVLGHVDNARVADIITKGQKCKQRLENKLRKGSPPPSQALSISPIKAVFSEPDRATTYSIPTITDQPGSTYTYQWTLTLQAVDPSKGVDTGCNNHGVLGGTGTTFAWHHGNSGDPVHDDGCNHGLQGQYGHQGLISVIVSDNHGAKCSATYKGTNSSDANTAAGIAAASKPECTQA